MANLTIIPAADASRTLKQSVSKTLSANNTTASVALWRVTGSVLVTKLYGVVTTVLGSNHTAAHWRLNDQTAQVDITLNTGTALSAAAAGSLIQKLGLAGAALTLNTSAAGRVIEAATVADTPFTPFTVVKKSGANTDIEYRYSTTDAPTSGVIQFFIEYIPLSADGALTAQ
jgi:hypothetical protein